MKKGLLLRVLFLSLLVFSLFSCAPKPRLSPELYRRARRNPSSFVREVQEKVAEVHSLGGRFTFLLNVRGKRRKAEGTLLAKRDSLLRLELGGPFGGTSLLFLMNKDKVYLYYIKDKKVVTAPATSETLFRLIGVNLSPSEVVAVVLGALVPDAGYRFSSPRFDEGKGLIEVRLSSSDGKGAVFIDPRIPSFSALEMEKRGKVVSVSYRSFFNVGFRLFPKLIEIELPDEGLNLRLRAKDITINPSFLLKGDAFSFVFPSDVTFIPLSHIKGETPLLFREGE